MTQTYTFFIEDDRYSVPTLALMAAADEPAARALARDKLAEPHHLSVEVHDVTGLLFKLIRPGEQDADAPPA